MDEKTQIQSPAVRKIFMVNAASACHNNLSEFNGYRKEYQAKGFSVCAEAEAADTILINTCGVNETWEGHSADLISTYQKRFPDKKFVISGCLPKTNPKRFGQLLDEQRARAADSQVSIHKLTGFTEMTPDYDPHDFKALISMYKTVFKLRPILFRVEKALGNRLQPAHNLLESSFMSAEVRPIAVARGCTGVCTFCVIKKARGSVQSRPLAEILAELDAQLARGYRKFQLIGDDCACWGQDIGSDVTELLDGILSRTQDFSLALYYFEPQYLVKYSEKVLPLLADRRITSINFPMQSGSKPVLRRMGRHYDPREVVKLVRELKRLNPRVALKSTFIVGFPGESWKDFLVSAWRLLPFHGVMALEFSAMNGAPAATFTNQISPRLKSLRWWLLTSLAFCRLLVAMASFRLEPSTKA